MFLRKPNLPPVILLAAIVMIGSSQILADELNWRDVCIQVKQEITDRRQKMNPFIIRAEFDEILEGSEQHVSIVHAKRGVLEFFQKTVGSNKFSETRVFDGKRTTIELDEWAGEKRGYKVSMDPDLVMANPSPWTEACEDYLLQVIDDCLSLPNVSGTVTQDGEHWNIKLDYLGKEGNVWAITVIVDTTRGMIPKQISIDTQDDGMPETTNTVLVVWEYGDVSIPSHIVHVTLDDDGHLQWRKEYKILECSVDLADIPKSMFSIEMQEDRMVYDVDNGAALVDQEEIDRFLKRTAEGYWTDRQFWRAAFNVGLLSLIIGLVWFRYRRRK